GLEKLARKPAAAFTGTEVRLPAQEVSPGAKSLELVIALPRGTKFNPDAPFRLTAASDKPDSVTVAPLSLSKAAERISIPIEPKAGEAALSLEMNVNYCSAGNQGL